jgi:hypothetical protein
MSASVEVIHSGYLTKIGAVAKNWKLRFMVLLKNGALVGVGTQALLHHRLGATLLLVGDHSHHHARACLLLDRSQSMMC